jgi:hypothetical protein
MKETKIHSTKQHRETKLRGVNRQQAIVNRQQEGRLLLPIANCLILNANCLTLKGV